MGFTIHPIELPMLSIDPGLGGTGWAYWESRKHPTSVGIVRDTARDDLLTERCYELCGKLWKAIPQHDIPTVIIEMPQHMTNRAGIAAQAGSVYKLAFLVGTISLYWRMGTSRATVHAIQPGEWKGQLPKDVVKRRIEQRLGRATCRRLNIRSHAYDAVGIGLWALGRL